MLTEHDQYVLPRCPRLGHELTFGYCRQESRGQPCRLILDCLWERFDVRAFFQQHLPPEDILASRIDLRFSTNIQPNIRVRADRPLLQTAILNLLDNAVKYNEPKGSISVSLAPAKDTILLTLCSTGPGIPPEDQPKLFQRYYRGDRARRQPAEGLGLGLSLAREIVRAHGGEVLLRESRPGRTCFELRLPPG